jgi:hypothetical protein
LRVKSNSSFLAYESDYLGGTRVAVADLTGNGEEVIVTAPGRGRAPEIRFFTVQGEPVPGFPSFLAYAADYEGGVHLTIADVDGDGKPDLITVPTSGYADVRVFLNRYNPLHPSAPAFGPTPDIEFRAVTASNMNDGFRVAAGDMGRWAGTQFVNDRDGRAEIVVGTGAGLKATVRVFTLSGSTPHLVQTFHPFTEVHSNFLGGASLEVARVDNDLIPDIIVGMGVNGNSRIEVWSWNTAAASLSLLGAIPNAFTGAGFRSPVNVAALTDGNGLAEAILAVQGPGGLSREIRRFEIVSRDPLQFQQDAALTGFPGPWFITTSRDFPYLPGEGEGEGESAGFWARRGIGQCGTGSAPRRLDRGRRAAEPWWTGLRGEGALRGATSRDSDDDLLFSDLEDWL